MEITLLSHTYRIYDRRQDESLVPWAGYSFATEEAAIQYAKRYGVEGARCAIVMSND